MTGDVRQCFVCHKLVQHPERYWYELWPGPRAHMCDEHGSMMGTDAWVTMDDHMGKNLRLVWRERLPVQDNPYIRQVKVHEIPLDKRA